jgi:hypothetical protein
MSYVIQHFYQPLRDMTFNPRLKLLLHCKNIFKLFLFYKFDLTFFNSGFIFKILSSGNLALYQLYFLADTDSIDYVFALKLSAANTTRLHKSLSSYGLNTLLLFFLNKKQTYLNLSIESLWFYNLNFFTVKITPFPTPKKFYKNVYLFLFLNNPFQ